MSTRALFAATTEDGSYYTPVSERLADLPKGSRLSGLLCWLAIVQCLGKDKTETSELITDKFLIRNTWLRHYQVRFVQKGLKALQDAKIIDRKRQNGRRIIIVLDRFKPSAKRSSPEYKDLSAAAAKFTGKRPTGQPVKKTPAPVAAPAHEEQKDPGVTDHTSPDYIAVVEATKALIASTGKPSGKKVVVAPDDPEFTRIRAELAAKDAARIRTAQPPETERPPDIPDG
jgi:hypothetical protein